MYFIDKTATGIYFIHRYYQLTSVVIQIDNYLIISDNCFRLYTKAMYTDYVLNVSTDYMLKIF